MNSSQAYKTLEINSNSDFEEVKYAYRKLALQPDGNSIFVVAIIAIIEIPAIMPIFTTLLKSMIYSHLIDKINNIIRNEKGKSF